LLMTTMTTISPSLVANLKRLQQGHLGLLGSWKRMWMLLMFMRRDRSWVRCLVDRARGLVHGIMLSLYSMARGSLK